MKAPPEKPPAEITMRRGPWWTGGRFRADTRRLPDDYDVLPLWARLGFMTPLQPHTILWIIAFALAALGGVGLGVMIVSSQPMSEADLQFREDRR